MCVRLIVLVSSKKLENIDFCSQLSFIWQYLWCLKCTTNFVVAVFISSLNSSQASNHICCVKSNVLETCCLTADLSTVMMRQNRLLETLVFSPALMWLIAQGLF